MMLIAMAGDYFIIMGVTSIISTSDFIGAICMIVTATSARYVALMSVLLMPDTVIMASPALNTAMKHHHHFQHILILTVILAGNHYH